MTQNVTVYRNCSIYIYGFKMIEKNNFDKNFQNTLRNEAMILNFNRFAYVLL